MAEKNNAFVDVEFAEFKGADDKDYKWVDADTLSDGSGQDLRILGYNAPETNKIIDENGIPRFIRGQVGGKETTSATSKIASAGGFNKVVDTGEVDSYNRRLVRLQNSIGEDLTNTLYRSGAVEENIFTDESGIRAAEAGRLQQEMRGKKRYANIVNEELGDIQQRPVLFKEAALNEKEYLQAVVDTVASQKGYNLSTEEGYRKAYDVALDGKYDSRSIPFDAIDFRYSDRTKEGVAYNQFSASWNTGWKGMTTALSGFAELAGVTLGSETLKNWGAENVEIAKEGLSRAPILRNLDYREVDGLWDGWQFMTNNMAMSAPYLITLTAGHALSPVTFGASIPIAYGSMFGVHSGNVWNDIEGPKGRKEAAGAMMAGTAMAVLDRLGMAGIMPPSALLTAAGRKAVYKYLRKAQGLSTVQAKAIVAKETKSVIKGAIEGMGNFSSDHINNSEIIKNILKGATRGGAGEAITEAGQEATGYLASASMSEGGLKENFNPNEFSNLLAQATVAGGTLGSAFGTGGQLIEAGDRAAMKQGLMLGRVDKLNEYGKLGQELGPQGSVYDITKDLNNKTKDKEGGTETNLRAANGEKLRGSLWNKLKDPTKYLPELYRAAATTAFRPELLRRSEAARKLYALIGQPLGRLYSGRDVESQSSRYRAEFLNKINPQRVFKRFGFSDRVKNSQKISDMLREYHAVNGDLSKLSPETLKYADQIKTTIDELKEFSFDEYNLKNGVYIDQGTGRNNLKYDPDSWLNEQSWDWSKVRNNRDAWFTWMRNNATDEKGNQLYTPEELEMLYNKVSNNEDATDFSVVEGIEYIPNAGKGGISSLSKKPGFDQFANTNILQNAMNTVNQTSKYAAYTEYFGAGGKHLDQLFNEMEAEGLTPEEVAEMAYHTKSIIDAGTGNFNSIKNRKLASFQRTGAFYASIIGLPLAAFSSFPEFVMLIYQGTGLKSINNAIHNFTGEMVAGLKDVAKMKVHPTLANAPKAPIYRRSVQDLIASGLFPDDATVATRYGLGEVDISKAWFQKAFFKWTGIAGVTQLQRSMAAASVSGFVSDRIRILMAKKEGDPYNQDQLDVYRQLVDLGMDVERFIELQRAINFPDVDANGQTIFDKYMDNGNQDPDIIQLRKEVDAQLETVTWYFVNDRIQNPQAYNRPLFFQDPHFQLFVQFNGFISTFTANIVPKLWNDYLKNGSPKMKYNTFALIVAMMGVAGASQWLKDYIKFGGSTPYLNDAQLVQRALMSSGILGSGERILQAAAPMYSDRGENLIERLFGETVGGAPTLRIANTAREAVGEIAEGDYEGFLKKATKITPVVSPSPVLRGILTDVLQLKKPSAFNDGE